MTNRENPRRILFFLSILGVVAYGALLIQNLAPGVGSSGERRSRQRRPGDGLGGIVQPIEALALLELPDRFAPALIPGSHAPGPRPGTMVPRQAPGFALHVVPASLVAGWDAGPSIVSPIAAILCLLLLFLFARELEVSRPFAFAGAAILAACPVFLFEAVQPTGDVTATMWAMASVYFALRARRSDRWASAAGAALGVAVLVRPANLLLLLPLGVCPGLAPEDAREVRHRRSSVRGLPRPPGTAPSRQFSVPRRRPAARGRARAGRRHPAPATLGHWLLVQLSPLVPLAVARRRRRSPRPRPGPGDALALVRSFSSLRVPARGCLRGMVGHAGPAPRGAGAYPRRPRCRPRPAASASGARGPAAPAPPRARRDSAAHTRGRRGVAELHPVASPRGGEGGGRDRGGVAGHWRPRRREARRSSSRPSSPARSATTPR